MIEAPSTLSTTDAKLPRGQALRRGLGANPLLVVGGLMSALIVVIALLAPLLAPFPADAGSATHPFIVLHPPSAQHWFGTDNVGRDIYSRVLYGARISPLIAVIVLPSPARSASRSGWRPATSAAGWTRRSCA